MLGVTFLEPFLLGAGLDEASLPQGVFWSDDAYAESNLYGTIRTLNEAGINIGQAFKILEAAACM